MLLAGEGYWGERVVKLDDKTEFEDKYVCGLVAKSKANFVVYDSKLH